MGHDRPFVKHQCAIEGKDRLRAVLKPPESENSVFLLALWFDFF